MLVTIHYLICDNCINDTLVDAQETKKKTLQTSRKLGWENTEDNHFCSLECYLKYHSNKKGIKAKKQMAAQVG